LISTGNFATVELSIRIDIRVSTGIFDEQDFGSFAALPSAYHRFRWDLNPESLH
jgi:hypothetical protein